MKSPAGGPDYATVKNKKSSPLVDAAYIASKIKDYFFAAKKEQHGKPYRPSPKFGRPEFWQAAAEICIDLKADPYSFVRAAFMYCAVPGGPYPHMLCGNAVRYWYKTYCELGPIADGEDPYASEVYALIRAVYLNAITSSQNRGITLKACILDRFLRQDIAPAFVRLILFPTDRDVLKEWGRIGYRELMCNQRLMNILHEKNYDLSFLAKVEQEMRGVR